MAVKPIPEGFHTVTPHLSIKDAAAAIEFYKKAFGAQEMMRLSGPAGMVMHAEIKIGDSPIMIAEEMPDWGNRSPQSLGGTPVTIHLYVEDVDAVARQAESAGAKAQIPVGDRFYGDRSGRFEDPYGHVWIISTHKEDMEPAEMQRRAEEFMRQEG